MTRESDLREMRDALDEFVHRRENSLGEPECPPEPILPGSRIHAAVVAVEQFYRHGKLPSPAWQAWTKLLDVSRHCDMGDEREARRAWSLALQLRDWVLDELARPAQPTKPKSARSAHPLEGMVQIDERSTLAAPRALRALFESPNWLLGAKAIAELQISDANLPNERVRYVRTAIVKQYPAARQYVRTRTEKPEAGCEAAVYLAD